jgi:hypothetical protein
MLGAGARAGEPEGYGRTTGGLGSRGVRGIHGTTRSPPVGRDRHHAQRAIAQLANQHPALGGQPLIPSNILTTSKGACGP